MSETLVHKELFTFHLGEYYSQPEHPGIPGTAKEAVGMWRRAQEWESDTGHSSVGPSGSPSYLQVVNSIIMGVTNLGNVASMWQTLWAAGNGNIVENGVVTGAVSGSLVVKVSGAYTPAGLAAPSAPGFAASATPSTKFNGTYSVGLVAVRVTSGAVSNISLRSAVIAVNDVKGEITLPATPFGATHFIVYGTPRGQGTNGVLRKVTTIAPIAVSPGAVIPVDWVDGELGDLAPITNDVPPACTHCFPLGSLMCVVSSGGMVYPSKPGQPEAFDVGLAVRLASGEAPVGITARGSDGGVFIGTRNSISLVVATGSESAPVLPRGVFENVGIANGNAMCWVYDTLYVFSAAGSLCRTHGGSEPDTSFATPIKQWLKDRGATGSNTYLIHDLHNGALLVCTGDKAKPYMLDTGEWSGEITLPGAVRGGIALNESGLVDVGGTTYTLNTAGGSPNGGASIRSPYLPCAPSGYEFNTKKFMNHRGTGTGSWTHDYFKNQVATTIGGPFPKAFTGPHDTNWTQTIINGIYSLAYKASCTSGGQKYQPAIAELEVDPAHVG
jgi:hypothetical protein